MADQIDTIRTEITNDPLTLGYSGMTDEQVADSMNGLTRSRVRDSMTRSEVMQSIDTTEFDSLADGQKADVWGVLGVETVDPSNGSFEEHVFRAVFGNGSTTIANLASARQESISRATELGISEVKVGHVQAARR